MPWSLGRDDYEGRFHGTLVQFIAYVLFIYIYIYTVHILCTYINLIHLFWSLSLLVCDVVLRRPFQFKFLFLVLCIDTSCYIYC